MTKLTIKSFGLAGPVEGFPTWKLWSKYPGVRSVLGSAGSIGEALRAQYSPLQLRRLDAYAQTALLASMLALEAHGDAPADVGLVVCTGHGPVPATNTFMDSYREFGPQGASPTAFSQTVHNLAASTISMFLGITGPSLSVSQPGLGLSSALLTARSWIDQGITERVLFGAVDDYQPFSRLLFPGCGLKTSGHDPIAAFAILTAYSRGSGLLEVQDITESRSPAGRPPAKEGFPGPVDLLSEFLTALNATRTEEEILVEESWADFSTVIRIRATTR
ncbi:MAG: beta-ketoacyl synthase chain length factor [Solidesulfovibrio sp.]